MAYYWISFADRPAGCVEASCLYAAQQIAAERTGYAPSGGQVLPYPAEPRLNRVAHQGQAMPSFCFDPQHCCGNTSCPKSHACVE